MDSLPRSVNIAQAAARLNVSRRTIYNYIRDGKLKTIRLMSGKSQRILVSSLIDNGWIPPDQYHTEGADR